MPDCTRSRWCTSLRATPPRRTRCASGRTCRSKRWPGENGERDKLMTRGDVTAWPDPTNDGRLSQLIRKFEVVRDRAQLATGTSRMTSGAALRMRRDEDARLRRPQERERSDDGPGEGVPERPPHAASSRQSCRLFRINHDYHEDTRVFGSHCLAVRRVYWFEASAHGLAVTLARTGCKARQLERRK